MAATLISAALLLPAGMYEAIWAIFLTDLGASTTFIGLSLTLYGVPFILAAPYGGRLADRHGPLRVAPIALVVIIPLTIVYGFMTVPILLMLFAMVEAVGNGLGMPASQALMAAATDEGERATGQGLAAAAGELMAGIAAVTAASPRSGGTMSMPSRRKVPAKCLARTVSAPDRTRSAICKAVSALMLALC